GLRQQRTTEPDLPVRPVPTQNRRLETLVPGEEVENEGGVCYVVTNHYALDTVRGRRAITDLLGRSPAGLASLYPAAGLDRFADFRRVAFVDTETTGLGGGAGIYAFMVGVGTFEVTSGRGAAAVSDAPSATSDTHWASHPAPLSFVVRQFFMRHPGEEL